jgi:hypothetical protein
VRRIEGEASDLMSLRHIVRSMCTVGDICPIQRGSAMGGPKLRRRTSRHLLVTAGPARAEPTSPSIENSNGVTCYLSA